MPVGAGVAAVVVAPVVLSAAGFGAAGVAAGSVAAKLMSIFGTGGAVIPALQAAGAVGLGLGSRCLPLYQTLCVSLSVGTCPCLSVLVVCVCVCL